ncbi:MAG: TM0106 family RecB-like putative nuclease [Candidatus Omnitrophica bacterium]|nr:TM0106 family RecB-like putative nuclease [Candidatus Omnitrophota bacterium]
MSEGKNRISPTALARSASCLHAYFLDCFASRSDRRRETAAERHVKDQGIAFQESLVESLTGLPAERGGAASLEEASVQTLEAMRRGDAWIYQGVLFRDDLSGIPDLLMKIPGRSALGDYTYLPVEIKSRKNPTLQDRLQLFQYAYLLEPVLGQRPSRGFVYAGSRENYREIFLEGKVERLFFELLRQLRLVRSGGLRTQALRCSACTRCLWSSNCQRVWEETDHISMLSGLSALMARKLDEQGISACAQLAAADPASAAAWLDLPLKHAERLIFAAKARSEKRAIVLSQPKFPEGKTLYFYDIETRDDRVFCHGIVRLRNGRREERCFFAEHPDREEQIWHELLDYLAVEEPMIVYCWTLYERTFVDICWRKFGGNPRGYDNLNRALTDQCAFVREHFALPCRGYSIKAVAPFFGFSWGCDDANGLNCVAWYQNWLETGSTVMRDKIIQYNLDDVRAMAVVDASLKTLVSG